MRAMAGTTGRRWLRIVARIFEAGIILVAFGLLLLWCSVPSTDALATENPSTTAFIDLRRGQAAAAGKPFALQWKWKPLGKISRYLRASIIYAEDYNFYRHDGIDWGAIESAVEANLEKGSLAIGGSTITQQLAKNLYLSPSRSFIRKLRELVIAYALEDSLTKQRILEIYLNVVEWGDGVFGAEAAARHWFNKSAQSLTPAEAVRLAIALPNPFTRAPNVRSPELTKKAVRLVRLLRLQGLLDEPQERIALDSVGAPDAKTLPTRHAAGEPTGDTGGAASSTGTSSGAPTGASTGPSIDAAIDTNVSPDSSSPATTSEPDDQPITTPGESP